MKTHLDLFSGIGGFALAAQWNGLTTVGFSEIEPYACKILKRHWPDVPNFGDIRFMDGQPCDLLTGGFPCQPFSCAGKQRGKADDRHLWPEMLRVIAASRPTWVLGENVPGIIKMELDQVLSDLEGIGYATWPVVVPACAVDAQHRRARVWIVAYAVTPGLEVQCQQPARQEQQATERGGTVISNPNGWKRPFRPHPSRVGREQEPLARNEPAMWPIEPELGRMVNGLSDRVDRIRGLGNSIVPQVAAQLIRFMIKAEQAA